MWLRLSYGRIQLRHVVSLTIVDAGPHSIRATTVDGQSFPVFGPQDGYATTQDAQAAIDSFILGDSLRTP